MAEDFGGKTPVTIEPFTVQVLGGWFTVKGLLLDQHQDSQGILDHIRSMPADRWFVMLSDAEENSWDVLAIIDDQFEFQSVALGTLESA